MDPELKAKLDKIQADVEAARREASRKGNTFIILSLIALLFMGGGNPLLIAMLMVMSFLLSDLFG